MIEEIVKAFYAQQDTFEELKSMVVEDTDFDILIVGPDVIQIYPGKEFRKKGKKWYDTEHFGDLLELEAVLSVLNIKKERYLEYLEHLESINCSRVGHSKITGICYFHMSASGLGVSGCLTSIMIKDSKEVPESIFKESYSNEVTPLTEGWYITHDCT